MQDNMEKPDAIEVLQQAKLKAAKQAEKKLFLASKGQTGFIPGKERNSLREQLGLRTPVAPLISNKIGRNAKCPCGSNKKFKHCHGR